MVHLSMLPHHPKWAGFYKHLQIVVVDEVHTYRGVMGSHMSQVFRRLLRICAHYGASPTFVFSSATVANPAQLARQLTGLEVEAITRSGAPQAKRHIVFIDPIEGAAQMAILLLKASLHRGLRTIVYTQSRKLTELIALWAGSRSGEFASRISAYRAGFLPEERREIEAKLSRGDLLAVISTSALELGIDIGDLDLCILVGYPGTIVATLQRGGRVGRSGQDSALVLVAGEDALDQYLIRNPEELIKRKPEAAIVNPYNPEILSRHLVCAAAEMPLDVEEPMLADERVMEAVRSLEEKGDLLKDAVGTRIYSRRKAPHREVNLRGAGDRFAILSGEEETIIGEMDGIRVFKEAHTGAVYLHKGETYLVDKLDLEAQTVQASKAEVDYYTRIRGFKDTEILEVYDEKPLWGTVVCLGRLKITDQVTGYAKWQIRVKRMLSITPLDLPPLIFETEGIWVRIPPEIQREAEAGFLHFMGGIHAMEHAAIGILPLLVMADRNDLGGISTPLHPQLGAAAVFIYDGVPGGIGLSRQAFQKPEMLLDRTLKAIASCSCENGCPSCVHSPKCGSGNRPIDKAAALFLLEKIREHPRAKKRSAQVPKKSKTVPKEASYTRLKDIRYGVFDLETQRSAQEVGGWDRVDRMLISCVVLYDSKEGVFFEFLESQIPRFVEHLKKLDMVIGFNIRRFDYTVLSAYTDYDFSMLPTVDLLEDVHRRLGYRLSLDHLARITLETEKSADGLQALKWWKEGRIREIIDYCKQDVAITRDLFLYGRKHGYLLFTNKAGNAVRVPVDWKSDKWLSAIFSKQTRKTSEFVVK
jgi:DEAD/DEAH box helicase domain-containing protein